MDGGAAAEDLGALCRSGRGGGRWKKLEDTLTKLISEFDAAHRALSEEGTIEWKIAIDQAAKVNLAPLVALLMVVICPIIFYLYIFLPCWECYDFTAAATHEVGHVLGLTHPDTGAKHGRNYWYVRGGAAHPTADMGSGDVEAAGGVEEADARRFRVNCTAPWHSVEVWPNTSTLLEALAISGKPGGAEAKEMLAFATSHGLDEIRLPNWQARWTIMATFSFNSPQTCIFQDDLDALNVLYPTCANAVLHPQCDRPRSYLGLVRLAAYVGLPVLVLLVVTILAHALSVHCHHISRERLKRSHPEQAADNPVEAHLSFFKARAAMRRGGGRGAVTAGAGVAPATEYANGIPGMPPSDGVSPRALRYGVSGGADQATGHSFPHTPQSSAVVRPSAAAARAPSPQVPPPRVTGPPGGPRQFTPRAIAPPRPQAACSGMHRPHLPPVAPRAAPQPHTPAEPVRMRPVQH